MGLDKDHHSMAHCGRYSPGAAFLGDARVGGGCMSLSSSLNRSTVGSSTSEWKIFCRIMLRIDWAKVVTKATSPAAPAAATQPPAAGGNKFHNETPQQTSDGPIGNPGIFQKQILGEFCEKSCNCRARDAVGRDDGARGEVVGPVPLRAAQVRAPPCDEPEV